jgi:hypothetical protein
VLTGNLTLSGASPTISSSNATALTIQSAASQSIVFKPNNGTTALTLITSGAAEFAENIKLTSSSNPIINATVDNLIIQTATASKTIIFKPAQTTTLTLGSDSAQFSTRITCQSIFANTKTGANLFLTSATMASGEGEILVHDINSRVVYTNAAKINTTGDITANSFNSTSDYRIKENVEPIENGEYPIESLRPVKYYNQLSKKNDIGFIAHELQEHLPLLVNGEKDGPVNQSINYTGLIPILVSEIQELKMKVKMLMDERHKHI